MNNTASVSQFLAVLGGSANPALLQNTGQQTGQNGNAFRSLFMTQFGAGLSQSLQQTPSDENGVTNPLTTQALNRPSQSSENINIWQLVNQQANDTSTMKNSIVLELTNKGIAPDVVDQLVSAVEQSDLVTILKDPNLTEQLQNFVDQISDQNSNEINIPKLADMIKGLNITQDDQGNFIVADVSEMDMDEFKEWKKNNFSDLAAFFNRPKTKIGENGEIIKVLQGPAFLQDETTDSNDVVIEIVQPQQALTPVEFALQFANHIATAQQSTANTTPQSFVPLSLDNLGTLPPEIRSALQNMKAALAQNGTSSSPTKTGGSSISSGQSNPSIAVAIASQGNNTTFLTPFTTPSDFESFLINGGHAGTDADMTLMPLEVGFKTASQSGNPILMQQSATQPHPTTQLIAVSLNKMASGKGDQADTQKYRLQLDPPEMGRVDIELEFDAGHKVKALITVDKPETLQLLQRDSHALLKSLQDAGFDNVGQDNLNFNLSQGQNDSAGHGGNNADDRQNGQNALLSPDGESELTITETEMSPIIDPITGQQRINMVV